MTVAAGHELAVRLVNLPVANSVLTPTTRAL
jgi:hypothetical protein